MKFRKIYFEIGNICNLQCSFCPEVNRAKFRISEENFSEILLQIKSKAERICLHLMGEPTAHPLFHKLVEIAEKQKVSLEITTNGTLLNETIRATLVNPTVVQVNFSLQSFFDNFPEALADKYLAKIIDFTKFAMHNRPDLYINYRLWNHSHQASSANEKIIRLVEIEFNSQINRSVDPAFRKSKKVVDRLYFHFDSRFEWPNQLREELSTKGTCHGGKDQIGIHADGKVVPCCLDKEADIELGNIYQSSLDDILKSDRYIKLVDGFKKGELVEDLCRRCQFATRFAKT